jgi:hypothetical protein
LAHMLSWEPTELQPPRLEPDIKVEPGKPRLRSINFLISQSEYKSQNHPLSPRYDRHHLQQLTGGSSFSSSLALPS